MKTREEMLDYVIERIETGKLTGEPVEIDYSDYDGDMHELMTEAGAICGAISTSRAEDAPPLRLVLVIPAVEHIRVARAAANCAMPLDEFIQMTVMAAVEIIEEREGDTNV